MTTDKTSAKTNFIVRDKPVKRVVIKVGSNLLVSEDSINKNYIQNLCKMISNLKQQGLECIIVSSGSVACGLEALGLLKKSTHKNRYKKFTIPQIQAAAAVGQGRLIQHYSDSFAKHNLVAAQLLVTYDDIHHRQRYLNIKNTIAELINQNIIPILNENDTVSVDEITFGDNDYLSALITHLVDADLLILSSTISGLINYQENDQKVISDIYDINKDIEDMIQDTKSSFGTGGMLSKITAAQKLMKTGHMLAIVDGADINNILNLLSNKNIGTVFHAKNTGVKQKKKWLGFASRSKGDLIIDAGAANAILNNNKSLLPIGILETYGDFKVGDIVNIIVDNKLIAKGQVNYNQKEVDKIKRHNSTEIKDLLGFKPYDEVILKDNMVILNDE